MKIIVKDYYAVQRGKARTNKLSESERKRIARKAIAKRWNKVHQKSIDGIIRKAKCK